MGAQLELSTIGKGIPELFKFLFFWRTYKVFVRTVAFLFVTPAGCIYTLLASFMECFQSVFGMLASAFLWFALMFASVYVFAGGSLTYYFIFLIGVLFVNAISMFKTNLLEDAITWQPLTARTNYINFLVVLGIIGEFVMVPYLCYLVGEMIHPQDVVNSDQYIDYAIYGAFGLIIVWYISVSVPWVVRTKENREQFQKAYLFNVLVILIRQVLFLFICYPLFSIFRCIPDDPIGKVSDTTCDNSPWVLSLFFLCFIVTSQLGAQQQHGIVGEDIGLDIRFGYNVLTSCQFFQLALCFIIFYPEAMAESITKYGFLAIGGFYSLAMIWFGNSGCCVPWMSCTRIPPAIFVLITSVNHVLLDNEHYTIYCMHMVE